MSHVQSEPASPESHSSMHNSLSGSLKSSMQAGDALILRLVRQRVGRSRPSGPLGRAKLRTVEGRRISRMVFILGSLTF